MRTIRYAYDCDTGLVVSCVGSEAAVPVLDYAGMTPNDGFAMRYVLQRVSIFALVHCYFRHIRKIPIAVKNEHRKFWGMKLLKA